MRLLALIFLLSLLQDPADKVKALVEKLGSDDIAEREKATAELVTLGPAALPALVDHLGRAEGETKKRLFSVVRRIERDHKVAERILKSPVVTLGKKTIPLVEALDELQKQSGIPIERSGLKAGDTVNVDIDKMPFWKALDAICKAHGGVMYTVASRRIIVDAVPYRDLPRVYKSGLLFFIDHFLVDQYSVGDAARITVKPALGWVPDTSPLAYRLDTESMKDDLGNDLAGESQWNHWIYIGPTEPENIGGALFYHGFVNGVPPGARVIATWKGKLHVRIGLEMVKAASIANPLKVMTGRAGGADGRLDLHQIKVVDGEAWLRATISTLVDKDAGGKFSDLAVPNLLVLTDSTGKAIRGKGEGAPGTGGMRKEGEWVTRTVEFTFKLAPGVEIASLDLLTPTDTQDVEIPFEFKDLRFRRKPK